MRIKLDFDRAEFGALMAHTLNKAAQDYEIAADNAARGAPHAPMWRRYAVFLREQAKLCDTPAHMKLRKTSPRPPDASAPPAPSRAANSTPLTVPVRLTGAENDPLYEQAIQHLCAKRTTSISELQLAFSIGYQRAERLIDRLAAEGIGQRQADAWYRLRTSE